MDLVKIGSYIAEKRKALGLTQKQLAEKLNMSDKSVSKWERGICLPDVSIYMELCSILRISINEFLAGEDIGAENVIEKSDSNLIQITKESKKKQKNLKTILAVVTVFAVIVSAILGTLFFHKLIQPKNYITAVDQTSPEMKTAELLSGTDGAYLFHYFTKDEFKKMLKQLSKYLLKGSRLVFDYPSIQESKEAKITEMLAKEADESMKAKYSFAELKEILNQCHLTIIQHENHQTVTEKYISNYNVYYKDDPIKAPEGVCYCVVEK